jgi:hypothetical protein
MDKTIRPVKKGLRVYDDLREAVKEMETINEKFYFHPSVDYGLNQEETVRARIKRLDCKCSVFANNRESFFATLKIRFLCVHLMKKLLEFPLHPFTLCLLKNRLFHGKERYVLLSQMTPVIIGFYSPVNLKWVNIYHFNREREVAIKFSYNIIEKKWSYGKHPPGGREIELELWSILKEMFEV